MLSKSDVTTCVAEDDDAAVEVEVERESAGEVDGVKINVNTCSPDDVDGTVDDGFDVTADPVKEEDEAVEDEQGGADEEAVPEKSS